MVVKIDAGYAPREELLGMFRDRSFKVIRRQIGRLKTEVDRVFNEAKPLIQDELDTMIPPSRERLQRAIVTYLRPLAVPVGKRIEQRWKGVVCPTDIEGLKNHSFDACGPETGDTYMGLFEAMKEKFHQLPHSDTHDIVGRYLRKQNLPGEDIDAAFGRIHAEYANGVWRETIAGLVKRKKISVSIDMCGDFLESGGRNRPEVVIRLVKRSSAKQLGPKPEKRKRKRRTVTDLTEREGTAYKLYQKLKNYSAVGREMKIRRQSATRLVTSVESIVSAGVRGLDRKAKGTTR